MKRYNLNDMIGGWFIGNFSPSVCKRSDFEVGIKKYKKGEFENAHYHKISTEYTVVISGKVEMGGVVYYEGDIIDGDFCEWNDYEQKERVISRIYHKIQYNQFAFNLNDSSVGLNPKGYYYQVHHPITIRAFSDYIEEASPNNTVGIPNYSYFSTTDNSFKWREVYPYGFVDAGGLGVNYPFLNGAHYPFSTYIFRLLPEGNEYIEQTIIQQPTVDPCE